MRDFFLDHEEPVRSTVQAMRQVLLNDPHLRESVKYGMPCFLYEEKPIVYIWLDKKEKHPYFLWVDGGKMHHPSLKRGSRKRMQIQTVDPQHDLEVDLIHEILGQAKKLRITSS